jgi:hypothetical protein
MRQGKRRRAPWSSPDEHAAVTERAGPRADDARPWAPPRVGVPVERRDPGELVVHGAGAGLLAGLALGVVEIVASAALEGDPWLPFDFATAIVVGPEALTSGFSVAASVALGTVIHLALSVTFGVAFLVGLALAFQLSARPLLMLVYGVGFAVAVWEVNFLGVVPLVAPELRGRLDLATQLWNGIASYSLVYGPVLAGYVIRTRPGVLDRWWQAGDREVA